MNWDAAKDTWEAVLVFGVVMVTASQVGGGHSTSAGSFLTLLDNLLIVF